MFYYEMRSRIHSKEELITDQNWSDIRFENGRILTNFQQNGLVSTVRQILKRMVNVAQLQFEQ